MRISSKTPRLLVACLASGLCSLAGAGPAGASVEQEAILQDDPKIVFADSADALDRTLRRLKAIGVDRVRVSVFWEMFGPAPKSSRRPPFRYDATDPRAYRGDAWRRYDRIVKLAAEHGLGVLLNLTAPAPRWAAGPRGRGFNKNRVVNPDVRAYGDWVTAVGARYSGSYTDPEPVQAVLLAPDRRRQAPPLPRVDHWSIWNEPNFPSWLYPQWRRVRGRLVAAAPARYRRLVEAAYGGLEDSGHAGDTILLGETASGGERSLKRGVHPLIFLRELYCLNRRYAPYRGRAARRRGCPATRADRRGFVRSHPGLFRAEGWAHHPYNRYFRPSWRHPNRDSVTMGDLRRLTAALDRVFFRWGSSASLPIWITEHGYQTRPPDPTARVSPFRAGVWIAEADFIAYRNPRVASTAQFLLFDDAPRREYSARRHRRIHWGTWQSGLFTERGRAKPTLDFFRHPIVLSRRRGRSVRVWGQYRPGGDGAAIDARIELRRLGDREDEWSLLRRLTVRSERGFLDVRVGLPASGHVRIVWTDPATGAERPSPALRVRVGR